MNAITFGIGYILANLLVVVSSADYNLLSETKVSLTGPYNFNFLNSNDFLVMEITVKNIPKTVTNVVFIYTTKSTLFSKESTQERILAQNDTEIKNGEVKFMILKSLTDLHNILVDVELETKEGLCNKAIAAEGKYASSPEQTNNRDHSHCVAPKPCEIVMDFNNLCGDNFNCNFEATKYICTLRVYNENHKKSYPYTLYQTYDNGNCTNEPRTKASFRNDYSYLEAEKSFYKIHTTKKDWHNATKVCVQEGASLFYPEDSDEVNDVTSFWKSKTPNLAHMYLGISDIDEENVFETIDGRSISEIYIKWNKDQPDNYNKNEDCLHITQNGYYNDIPCTKEYSFICKKSLLSRERNIQQNLSNLIGAPLDMSTINAKFIIELEAFDNNTSINVSPLKFFSIYKLWSNKIVLTAEDVVKDNIVATLTYSETTEVEFSCQNYTSENTQAFVNLINKTKESKIRTFNETQINRKFKIADNGSILCCLYYKFSEIGNWTEITRVVVNKTLLKYQSEESMSLTPTTESNATGSYNIAPERSDYTWLIYLSAAVIGLSVMILALYIISKRYWFKNSQPAEETVEFENHVDQNQVLYADLEFVNNANRRPNQNKGESHYANVNRPPNQNKEESLYANVNQPRNQNVDESHYANIIGIVHPQ